MQSTINQRIVEYCKFKGKRQADLEKAKYASKQTLSAIWNEKSKPSSEFLERFVSDNKDLNARWLFSGEGKMIEDTTTIEFLENKLKEKEEEIKNLNQEIGSLKAQLRDK